RVHRAPRDEVGRRVAPVRGLRPAVWVDLHTSALNHHGLAVGEDHSHSGTPLLMSAPQSHHEPPNVAEHVGAWDHVAAEDGVTSIANADREDPPQIDCKSVISDG